MQTDTMMNNPPIASLVPRQQQQQQQQSHHNTPPTPSDSVWEHMMSALCAQIEYYFSIQNLMNDDYLWGLLTSGPDVGKVHVACIVPFPLIIEWYQYYCSCYGSNMHPEMLVAQAINSSDLVYFESSTGLLVPQTFDMMQSMLARQYASPVPTVSSSSTSQASLPPQQQAWGGYNHQQMINEQPPMIPLIAQPMAQGMVAAMPPPPVWDEYHPMPPEQQSYFHAESFDSHTEGSPGMMPVEQQWQPQYPPEPNNKPHPKPPQVVVTTTTTSTTTTQQPVVNVVEKNRGGGNKKSNPTKQQQDNFLSKMSEHSTSTQKSGGSAYQHKKLCYGKKKGYNNNNYNNNCNKNKKNFQGRKEYSKQSRPDKKVVVEEEEQQQQQPVPKDTDFPPLVPVTADNNKMATETTTKPKHQAKNWCKRKNKKFIKSTDEAGNKGEA